MNDHITPTTNHHEQALPDGLSQFYGANAGYVVELYERYLRDPLSVDPQTRAWFASLSPREVLAETEPAVEVNPLTVEVVVGVTTLARAIRAYGHLAAHLDPLGTQPPGDPSLDLGTHGLTEVELAQLPAYVVRGPAAQGAPNAAVAIARLREVYCGTTGYEFRDVQSHAERSWLWDAVESRRFREPHEPIDQLRVLRQLTEVEAFEHFLHRTFPGQKRFSIEGLDLLVPMLEEFIGCAAEDGAQSTWIGMAHRGRLAVLAQVLGKPLAEIFAEFIHNRPAESVSPTEREDEGWTGDVTYHLGARSAYGDGRAVEMLVTLAPNPSHLEYVDPVVEGMCRAASERRDRPGEPTRDEDLSRVVLIHGDAAFAGEGIVAETLNLSRLDGYRTGGTIHIIANNQLGFTTPPSLGRSTLYASDLAKGFEIPVVHVNADDVPACIAAMRLAYAYRQLFHKDFLIDLVGYRRWGHNEAEEPSFTQPRLYARIRNHPTVRKLWADRLIQERQITAGEADQLLENDLNRLQEAYAAYQHQPSETKTAVPPAEPAPESGPPVTAVPAETLIRLNADLNQVPPGFTINPKLVRWIERRREAVGPDGGIDWAQAEALAFASLLADGTAIRLTGQDASRGTFSQRHLVLHDAQTGETHVPLQALPEARASFVVYDTPLAEAAPLGFEYGYSVQSRDALVLWEAQFGDFANVAQVVLDQFIATGRAKWAQNAGLVLLLPHGLEGQGPEHSSGRPERFLQLAAQDNLQIANCTTAANYFHLLRRQARWTGRRPRPLVIFTPKSLLRHPLASAHLDQLAHGAFEEVIDDVEARKRPDRIRRLVLCSGHVYVDLVGSPHRDAAAETAIVRVEQLYPFPVESLRAVIAAYPKLSEVIWTQEEPMNMGAWSFVAPRLIDLLNGALPLTYVGRTERAAPSVGAHNVYAAEQDALVRAALGLLSPADVGFGVEVKKEVRHGSPPARPDSGRVAGRSHRRSLAEAAG